MLSSTLLTCLLVAAPGRLPVQHATEGARWRLTNGIVELLLDTRAARVHEFRFCGGRNVLGPGGVYLDSHWVPTGYNALGENPTLEEARVCHCTRDLLDVAVRGRMADAETGWRSPAVFDWHFVLRRGDAGFYTYVAAEHVAGAPAQVLGEWRTALQADLRFTDYALTPEWTGRLADHEWKYTLGRAWEPWRTHGLVDPKAREGVFAVYGATHWYRGPDQRELTLHQGNRLQSEGPYLLIEYEAAHYGLFPTSRQPQVPVVGPGWRKVGGPVFYALVRDGSAAEMWRWAHRRAQADWRAWPQPWLRRVVGTLGSLRGWVAAGKRRDPVRVALRNDRYNFWTTCRPGQGFVLPRVIAGTYDLIARQGPWASTEIRSVRVGEGVTTLAALRLAPSVPPGRLLWGLGRLDDSCEEFSGGTHWREFRGYERFREECPRPCEFLVGISRAERDWYWLHPGPYDTWAGSTSHPWTIRFSLSKHDTGGLVLHLAFADCFTAAGVPPPLYAVELNGRRVTTLRLRDGGQAATYCTAPVGTPQHYRIRLAGDALRVGENALRLWPEEGGYVMYDWIGLRVPHESEDP